MKRNFFGVLLMVSALGSDSPQAYSDGATRQDPLAGSWVIVEVTSGGIPLERRGRRVYRFHDGKYTLTLSDEVRKGIYRVNEVGKPAWLDWEQTEPPGDTEPSKYIFERVDADTFRMARAYGWEGRPTGFDDPRRTIIATFKRVK
jgi:uncharacterized protein (TIGR03067 family)